MIKQINNKSLTRAIRLRHSSQLGRFRILVTWLQSPEVCQMISKGNYPHHFLEKKKKKVKALKVLMEDDPEDFFPI